MTVHCRYLGVEDMGSNYAAAYSYLINIRASLFTNFVLKTGHTDEQSYFAKQKLTIPALHQQMAPWFYTGILVSTEVC